MSRVGNCYKVKPGTRHHWGKMTLLEGDVIEVMVDLGFTVVVRKVDSDGPWESASDSLLGGFQQLEQRPEK